MLSYALQPFLRNTRKAERGAKQFLVRLVVRAAPFALRPKLRPLILLLLAGAAIAQAPIYTPKPYGNLKQVMRSVALPSSNIILGIQQKPPKTDLEWQTVVNASVAIEELENLIMIPGRIMSNGQQTPVQNADFAKFAAALAPAGRDCLKASLQKSQDAVTNCTDSLSQACDNCHKVYRDLAQK
jgi:cytochrome c556